MPRTRAANPIPHFLILLAAGVVAAACATSREAESARDDGRWNDTGLLARVAEIGDEESDYDALASVARFEELQRAIEEVKQMVLHEARSETEALEGLRMVWKHLAVATRDAVQTDLRNPLFAKRDPRERDIGAYNPDAEYDQAWIDGRYDYVLTGHVGTVPYLSITVNATAADRRTRAVAYLDDAAIRAHTGADGRFTLWLTKQRPAADTCPQAPCAWVELPDDANGVVIRQYVADRARDELARFAIQATGDRLPPVAPLRDDDLAARLGYASAYLVVSSTWHRTLLPQTRERPNEFVASTGSAIGASAANLENAYQMAYWELGPGEALVIDVVPPRTVFWNLTSATFWHESQRHLTDPVSLTSSEIVARADGTVRFVLAERDPGAPNWLATLGHERGFLLLRMVGVAAHPLPVVRRVALDEVAALP